MKYNPCKECPERVVGCHSACIRYKAYLESQKERRKANMRDSTVMGYITDEVRKSKKRGGK